MCVQEHVYTQVHLPMRVEGKEQPPVLLLGPLCGGMRVSGCPGAH